MSSNLKVNSLVPATGTAIGIGTTGGSLDFRCAATFGGNVTIGGTLTYDEVINIDSIGIVTARSGLKVTGGQLDVGNNIKLGNAGVVTATSYRGDGSQLTGITGTTINNNANNRVITGSGSANTLEAESTLLWSGNALSAYRDNATTYGPGIVAHHQRGTIGSPSIVQTNDTLLNIVAKGYDGDEYHDAARIDFISGGGTPGNNDMPGSILFKTTDDGQASSTTRLTIQQNGNLLLDNSSTLLIPDAIQHVGDTNTSLRFPSADTITAETAGSERLRIDSSGSVLIGTNASTPLYRTGLQVVGGSGSTGSILIRRTDDGTPLFRTLVGQSGQNVSNTSCVGNWTGAGYHTDGYDECAQITMNADGNVSNGTLPGRIVFFTHKSGTGLSEVMRLTSGGDVTIGNSSVAFPSGGGLQVYNASAPRIKLTNSTTGVASGDGFQIYVSGSGAYLDQKENAEMRFYTNATERLRIASTGEVGIGIATPTKTGIQNNVKVLQIDGGDGAELILGNSTSSNVSVNHIGAIAFKNIDSSTGSAPHYAGIRCNCTDTSGNMNLKFYAGGGGGTGFEDDTPDMTINSVGRVGVGTDSPTARLHTYNTASDGLQLQSSGYNSYVWQIQANGNLNNGSIAGDLGLRGHSGISMSANAGTATQFRLTASDLAVTGTTDGVLNLDTSDSRGCFIRYKQGGTTQAWAGIPQGFGAGGNTDFGIRSNRHIYFMTGGGNQRWSINTDGTLYPASNNTYNIGGNSERVNKLYSQYWIHRHGQSSGVSWNESEAIFIQGGMHFFHDYITLSTSNFSHGITGNRTYNLIRMKNAGSGAAIYAESGAISSGSDYRMKENIAPITGGIEAVKKLKPCTYNIKKSFNEHDAGGTHQGFIAHEVQEAIPNIVNIVNGNKDDMEEIRYKEEDDIPEGKKPGDGTGVFTDKPDMQGIDYGHMTPILAAALKELIAKVEDLESEVFTLRQHMS